MSQKNCTESPQYVIVRAKSNVNLKRVELPEGAKSGNNEKASGFYPHIQYILVKILASDQANTSVKWGEKWLLCFFLLSAWLPLIWLLSFLFDLISVPQCYSLPWLIDCCSPWTVPFKFAGMAFLSSFQETALPLALTFPRKMETIELLCKIEFQTLTSQNRPRNALSPRTFPKTSWLPV